MYVMPLSKLEVCLKPGNENDFCTPATHKQENQEIILSSISWNKTVRTRCRADMHRN